MSIKIEMKDARSLITVEAIQQKLLEIKQLFIKNPKALLLLWDMDGVIIDDDPQGFEKMVTLFQGTDHLRKKIKGLAELACLIIGLKKLNFSHAIVTYKHSIILVNEGGQKKELLSGERAVEKYLSIFAPFFKEARNEVIKSIQAFEVSELNGDNVAILEEEIKVTDEQFDFFSNYNDENYKKALQTYREIRETAEQFPDRVRIKQKENQGKILSGKCEHGAKVSAELKSFRPWETILVEDSLENRRYGRMMGYVVVRAFNDKKNIDHIAGVLTAVQNLLTEDTQIANIIAFLKVLPNFKNDIHVFYYQSNFKDFELVEKLEQHALFWNWCGNLLSQYDHKPEAAKYYEAAMVLRQNIKDTCQEAIDKKAGQIWTDKHRDLTHANDITIRNYSRVFKSNDSSSLISETKEGDEEVRLKRLKSPQIFNAVFIYFINHYYDTHQPGLLEEEAMTHLKDYTKMLDWYAQYLDEKKLSEEQSYLSVMKLEAESLLFNKITEIIHSCEKRYQALSQEPEECRLPLLKEISSWTAWLHSIKKPKPDVDQTKPKLSQPVSSQPIPSVQRVSMSAWRKKMKIREVPVSQETEVSTDQISSVRLNLLS